MNSVGGLSASDTPPSSPIPVSEKMSDQRVVTNAALDALSRPSSCYSSSSYDFNVTPHPQGTTTPSKTIAIPILNPELKGSDSETEVSHARTPLTPELASRLASSPGVLVLTGGEEPSEFFTLENYNSEVRRFANLAKRIPKEFVVMNHPLLANEIELQPVGGSGAKSGVYFIISIDKDTHERKKVGVLKPMDEGYLCPNNPKGQACFARIQVQAGIYNDESMINGAVCSQLAKLFGLQDSTPSEVVTKHNGRYCSIQPFIEGRSFEDIFRNLATDQVFSSLLAGLPEDKKREMLPEMQKIAKEGGSKELRKYLTRNEIAIENDTLKVLLKILDEARSGGSLEGIENRLKSLKMFVPVENAFNQIIAKMPPKDFDDILILNWILGQQDLNLGGIMESGDRCFSLDMGSTLGELHGEFRTCYTALDKHPNYTALLSEHFKGRCKVKDEENNSGVTLSDENINSGVTLMESWGKSEKSKIKLRERLLLLRDLAKVDGMTPEKFIYFTQLSPILRLKERGKKRGIDLTTLFTKNEKGLAAGVFRKIDFSKFQDIGELVFVLTVRGMTLNNDCTARDLYEIPKLKPEAVLIHIKAALEFIMLSKDQSNDASIESRDPLSLLQKLVNTNNMTLDLAISIMQNPQILSFWERGIDITPIFTEELKELDVPVFFETKFARIEKEINALPSQIETEQDDDAKELLQEKYMLLNELTRFLRAAHGLMLPKDEDLEEVSEDSDEFNLTDILTAYDSLDDDIIDAWVENSKASIPDTNV